MKKIIKKIVRKTKKIVLDAKYKHKSKLNLNKISKITNLTIPEDLKKMSKKTIKHIAISDLDLKPNCIYFCNNFSILKDENKERIRKKALFVVASEKIEGCNCIVTNKAGECGRKTLNYLRNLSNAKVVAVTGSIGKTSTKEMIESVLKQKYKNNMITSKGNSNSSRKAAGYVQELSYVNKVYLQEVGAGSMANDIVKRSAEILETDIAVYTNIRDNHIEWYKTRENIAKEKFTLSDYGKKNGLAIINYDDEILRKHKFIQDTVSYSLNNKKATYYAKDIEINSEGTKFKIVDTIKKDEIPAELKVIGEHHILNALVAYAVGKNMNLSNKQIIKGIKKYKTSGARQNLINLGKYKVLADCYNSSYDALNNILKTLEVIKTNNKGEKVAVIGDIFEMGDISEKIHRNVGELLTKFNLKKVIFVGDNSKFSYEEYSKLKENGVYCTSRKEVIDKVKEIIEEDDIILFKASHGMHFAELIDTIFGTDIGETSALNHKEYTSEKDNNYTYNIFENHVTINNYHGKEKNIVIPKEYKKLPVEKLDKELFKNNKKINEITLSDNIAQLRKYCFENSSLKSININKSLLSIGVKAFSNCKKLETITLPNGFLVIEYKAFLNCKNLKEIYIPESIKKISSKAFLGCKKITIMCKKDSYADEYAKKHNIKTKYI